MAVASLIAPAPRSVLSPSADNSVPEEVALGQALVEKVHNARISGVQDETTRKDRWDLLVFATLSREVRDRSTGSFQDGKSKALGKTFHDMADMEDSSPDTAKRMLKVVRRVLDEVFLLAKAGEADAFGVEQRVAEGFLPQIEAVQHNRKLVEALVLAYRGNCLLAKQNQWGPTLSSARQILSCVAGAVPVDVLTSNFGCTKYEVTQAKYHAGDNGAGGRAPIEAMSRMCRSEESMTTFDAFISMYTSVLDASGKNAVRGLVNILSAEIGHLYPLYEEFCASRIPPEEAYCPTVFRDLCSRDKGYQDPRMETCVCSWCKNGKEAFDRILKVVASLPAGTEDQKKIKESLKRRVAAYYRWLKDSMANKCLRGNDATDAPAVASHCSVFLQCVDDEINGERPFSQQCKHGDVHDVRCERCDEFENLQIDIGAAIKSLAPPAEQNKLLEVISRCFSGESGIFRYIGHLVRDFHQSRYRDQVLRQMLMYQILVWCDYAMKWLPMKKLQTIADRMGLSGVSVHNFVVIKKLDGGKFMYLNFRVSCDDATQCFIHSLNGTRIVLDVVKSQHSDTREAYFGTDNDVNYSGIGYVAGLMAMESLTGIRVISVSTNEPGMVRFFLLVKALRLFLQHSQLTGEGHLQRKLVILRESTSEPRCA